MNHKAGLHQNQIHWHLNLGLPSLMTVRSKFPLFISHLAYSVRKSSLNVLDYTISYKSEFGFHFDYNQNYTNIYLNFSI